ncbi:hypothetical protein, conserved [Leishmania tarentolae]|uniref:Transmembrane protein n=1 Tax=Leishmania tarentolae TaxID=5689 RepID=A0A640KTR3_LEITA|nr:hypothetical protein, conserved [Leishmania tarentolae]
MPVASSFVEAVRLSGTPVLVDTAPGDSRAREGTNSSNSFCPHQDHPNTVSLVSKVTMSPPSNFAPGSSDSRRSALSKWQDLCGGRAYIRCFLAYVMPIVFFGILLLAVSSWCFTRWWRFRRRWLSRWRYFVADASDEENDSAARSGDAMVYHRALLSGCQRDLHDAPDNERAGYRAAESASAVGTSFHTNSWILQGARLWGAGQQAPVGFFYMLTQQRDWTDERRRTKWSAMDTVEEETDIQRCSCSVSREGDRNPSASPRASAARIQMEETLCLTTTFSDSSESGNDHGVRRDVSNCESSACDRRCSCESDSGVTAHAEVERPVLCGTATAECRLPCYDQGDILTHLIHFNDSLDAGAEVLASDCENNASDSQKPCDGRGAMTRSTASDASVESSANTPPPSTSKAESAPQGSESSVCLFDEDTFHDTLGDSPTLSHVASAIFDAEMMQLTDRDIADDVLDRCYYPPALSTSAPLSSTVTSYISERECAAPPSEHDSMATPSPVPHAAFDLSSTGLTKAALPTTDALHDTLDMVEKKFVDEGMDGATCTPSCIPTPQVQRLSESEPPKQAKKNRSKRYCEPWQPVLVSRKVSPLAGTDVGKRLAAFSSPSGSLRHHVRGDPDTNALADELDDLVMLADEVDSAQSSAASNNLREVSGSNMVTLPNLTSSMDSEQEMAGAPLVNTRERCSDTAVCLKLETVRPLVPATNPLPPASTPIAVRPRAASVAQTLPETSNKDFSGHWRWSPHAGLPRPALKLSVEERRLLLKSKKWLFPLIDGTDEIEEDIREKASPH